MILVAAIAGCGKDEGPSAVATWAQPRVDFSPVSLRVGEKLRVTGENFVRGEVTVVLIPETQFGDLIRAEREGNLYVLDGVSTENGRFELTLELPPSVTSENGALTLDTDAGSYQIGVHDGHRVAARGVLTVLADP
jgi:hypothetical protein